MLNETASSTEDRPVLRPSVRYEPNVDDARFDEVRRAVATVLLIEREMPTEIEQLARDGAVLMNPQSRPLVTYEGRLLGDSEAAYDQLDGLLKESDHFALFRERDGKHIVHVLSGRVNPKPRRLWVNVVLFILTVFSVLIVGTEVAIGEIIYATNNDQSVVRPLVENFFFELWRGLPYAVSIILILGAHEMGHYFAARRHNIAVTLPYFIPAPFISFLGTFGAAIQLREPMRNRKVLLDVGAAGPLAGLLFAIPILFIGLATSPVGPLTPGGLLEGNSFLYALAKTIVFGRFLPDGAEDVYINQLARAGWAGLLVTALNLIPLGQLDGGHILFSLIGNAARRVYWPLVVASVALAFVSEAWIFWIILLFLLGRVYAVPLDMITPLDRRRRFWAILSLFLFIVIFVPIPLTQIPAGTSVVPRDSAMILPMLTAMGLVLVQRMRARWG
jgi:membrane-associated protease RseP (regulator of RpoE activity)